jgi:phosphoribosylglycinamide formyltransferase-1
MNLDQKRIIVHEEMFCMVDFSNLDQPIAVFGYSFPHKKTYDFLSFLHFQGFKRVCVIAAPKVKLTSNSEKTVLVNRIPDSYPMVDCRELCKTFKYNYLEVPHSESNSIKKFLENENCTKLAIISGARILDREIIKLFSIGVVNFHPGHIPETSGLDSFYWMLKKGGAPGTTVHFIDHRVDAGRLIFFQKSYLSQEDTPPIVMAKLYDSQLVALNRLLLVIKKSFLLHSSILHRDEKNQALPIQEKVEAITLFQEWKRNIIINQLNQVQVFECCQIDDVEKLKTLINKNNLEKKDDNGRTPLAVAAYNQCLECLELLLSLGANVNGVNDKGTSIVMYAKTGLLNKDNPDMKVLRLLIDYGANLNHKDIFGNDVFFYIERSGDSNLSKQLRSLC